MGYFGSSVVVVVVVLVFVLVASLGIVVLVLDNFDIKVESDTLILDRPFVGGD